MRRRLTAEEEEESCGRGEIVAEGEEEDKGERGKIWVEVSRGYCTTKGPAEEV